MSDNQLEIGLNTSDTDKNIKEVMRPIVEGEIVQEKPKVKITKVTKKKEKEIITNNIDHYSTDRIKAVLTVAEQFFKAGCFTSDVQNTQQAYVKIQAGAEMGLPPMEAMSDLVLLKGNVTFWGKGLVKRFRKFGWRISYIEESQLGVTACVTNGDEEYSERAEKKDVENGYGYKKDPKAKLRYHALSRIARQYIPEILGSVNYTIDEIMDEDVNEFESDKKSINVELNSQAEENKPFQNQEAQKDWMNDQPY